MMANSTLIPVRFDADRTAWAIRVRPSVPPERVLADLNLPPYSGIVVVHGGAGKMDTGQLSAVRDFLAAGLAPLAEERRLLVVDGGTQSGVTRELGEARCAVGGTFPLVGVAPYRYVMYPGGPSWTAERIPLNPDHTHFVFVDGNEFGVESQLLVGMLRGSGQPGVALIINGGEIVFQEVLAHARQGNTIVTVRHSGRVADQLADPDSPERAMLPPGTRLRVANLHAPQTFKTLLRTVLAENAL